MEVQERVPVPRVAQFLISAAELEYLHNAEMLQNVELLQKDVATMTDKHGMEYKVHRVKATIMDSRCSWARNYCRERTPKLWDVSNEFMWLEEEPEIDDIPIWDEEV
ncbi:MAG TPA: hypothetical protein VMW91_08295 [Desulfosporosinus sp.]|nr:hypothetical protein [Desulfosporosinus sp.]